MLGVGNRTQWGQGGNVKEGLKLTPMSSFDVEQGGVNSGPGSCGVLEGVGTDGPSFSLCAAPLESSGPGFRSVGQRSVNKRRSRGVPDWRYRRGLGEEESRLVISIVQGS